MFAYVLLAGYVLTTFLHGSGIWLVYSVRVALVNQRLIILNLASSELLASLERVAYWCGFFAGYRDTVWMRFGLFLYLFTAFITKFIMMLLTLDRFFAIYLHMRYTVYITKTRLVRAIAILWFSSVSLSMLLVLVAIYALDIITMYSFFFYIYFGLDMIICVTALVTYMYFFIKTRDVHVRERKLSSHLKEYKAGNTSKKFLVPCLTVASYILLNVGGTTVRMVIHIIDLDYTSDMAKILSHVGFFLVLLGWLADWMIYILLQQKIRKKLLKGLCKNYNNKEHSRGTLMYRESSDGVPLRQEHLEMKVIISGSCAQFLIS